MSARLVLQKIGQAQVGSRAENERIEATADSLSLVRRIPFVCECAALDCGEIVWLGFDEYEEVRRYPRRFFNLPGHEALSVAAGAERIVAGNSEYVVVEKIGVAGEVAAAAHGS